MKGTRSYSFERLLSRCCDLIPELMHEVVLQRGLGALRVTDVHLGRCKLVEIEGDVVAKRCGISGSRLTCALESLLRLRGGFLPDGATL